MNWIQLKRRHSAIYDHSDTFKDSLSIQQYPSCPKLAKKIQEAQIQGLIYEQSEQSK